MALAKVRTLAVASLKGKITPTRTAVCCVLRLGSLRNCGCSAVTWCGAGGGSGARTGAGGAVVVLQAPIARQAAMAQRRRKESNDDEDMEGTSALRA